MAIDVEALLQPLEGEEPCGPDLSYDSEFRRISRELDETAAKERPGDDPSVGPNAQTAIDLLGRSKDLWIASHGVCFALYNDDLTTAGSLLEVMGGIVERYWEACYPILDEGSDPAASRREACKQIANIGRTVKHLERLYISPLRAKGKISFKDVMGAAPADANAAQILGQLSEGLLRAVDDTELAPWQSYAAALGRMLAAARHLAEAFGQRVPGAGPDMKTFETAVFRLKGFADGIIARKSPTEAAVETPGEDAVVAEQLAAVPVGPRVSGPIATRAQAIQQLEAVRAFFAQTEPSSPIPLMIDRVKRLADMDFMALLQNLAPSGVDDARRMLEPPEAG